MLLAITKALDSGRLNGDVSRGCGWARNSTSVLYLCLSIGQSLSLSLSVSLILDLILQQIIAKTNIKIIMRRHLLLVLCIAVFQNLFIVSQNSYICINILKNSKTNTTQFFKISLSLNLCTMIFSVAEWERQQRSLCMNTEVFAL